MGSRSARVDSYIEQAADFARPVLQNVRALYHEVCPELEETIKWGVPYFEYGGLLGGMAAFEQHVSLGFWKASLMEDRCGLLKNSGTQMSAIKVTGADDLPADEVLADYILQGMAMNEAGIKLPDTRSAVRPELEIPNDLRAALAANDAAAEVFQDFSYSNRKDYVEWLTDAKQQATRARRLAQAIEWMAEGKPREWKYIPKYRDS